MIDLNETKPSAPRYRPDDTEAFRAQVRANAESICAHILKGGRRIGAKWVAGDIYGSPGKSCTVELFGPKATLVHDFAAASGEGFDLIKVWQHVRGLKDFAATRAEMEAFMGAPFKAPAPKPEPKEDRGKETARYRYTDAQGAHLLTVIRYDNAAGKKTFLQQQPDGKFKGIESNRPLYNLVGIASASHVVLVEGEKAADALIAQGIPATTALGGASPKPELTDAGPLRGKKIIIWPDNDAPGMAYAENWKAALARADIEARIVTPPQGKRDKWDAADAIAEGFDVHTFLNEAAAPKPETFATLDLDALAALKPPAFLIDGYLVEGGLALMYGAPGSLKSFAALDMGLSIGFGVPWQGAKVEAGAILYVAGEGAVGLAKRAQAWRIEHNVETTHAPFRLLPVAVNLMEQKDVTKLIETLKEIIATEKTPIKLVIIDTVARAMPGAEENSAKDMGLFVLACDQIKHAIACAVMGVHHAGKDTSKGLRGSSALLGAADTVLLASRSDNLLTLTCEKQKDAEEPAPITLKTKTVFLDGKSPDPNDLNKRPNSLVLEKTDATARPEKPTIKTALEKCIKENYDPEQPHPPHAPSAPYVRRDVFAAHLLATKIAGNKASAVRSAINRFCNAWPGGCNACPVQKNDDFIWLLG